MRRATAGRQDPLKPGAAVLEATLSRLHAAEAQLWDVSQQDDGNMLLAPAMLQTWSSCINANQSAPPTPHRRDVSYLHDREGHGYTAPRRSLMLPSRVSPRSAAPPSPRSRTAADPAAFTMPALPTVLPPGSRPMSSRAARADRQAKLLKQAGVARPVTSGGFSGEYGEDESSVGRAAVASRRRAPSSRTEAIVLGAAFRSRLDREGESVSAYDSAFGELVDQVGSHCSERGELLGNVRAWMLRHIWWLDVELKDVRRELAAQEKKVAELQRRLVEATPVVDKRRSVAPAAEDAEQAAKDDDPERKQMEGELTALRALAIGKSTRRTSVLNQKGPMNQNSVIEWFEGLEADDAMKLLGQLLGSFTDEELATLIQAMLLPSISDDLTGSMLKDSIDQMDAAQRSSFLLDMLQKLPASGMEELLRAYLKGVDSHAAVALLCAVHDALPLVQRIDALVVLEANQFEPEEREYLGSVEWAPRATKGIQTDGAPLGWPRVMQDYTQLEEGARVKLLQELTKDKAWSNRELALLRRLLADGTDADGAAPLEGRWSPEAKTKLTMADAARAAKGGGDGDEDPASFNKGKARRTKVKMAASDKGTVDKGLEGRGGTLHPEEMLLRVIGEVWAKKIFDDSQMDARRKPRLLIMKFLRDHFMRQYGVKSVAVKAMGDIVTSLRVYAKMTPKEAGNAKLENRDRLHIFASMVGATEEQPAPWTARKVNFFLHVVGSLTIAVGARQRRMSDETTSAAEVAVSKLLKGAKRSSTSALSLGDKLKTALSGADKGDAAAVKERLVKKHLRIRLKDFASALPRFVRDASLKAALHESAQGLAFEDPDSRQKVQVVDLDAFLTVVMGMWQREEEALTVARLSKLEELVREFDEDGNGLLSFDEFELLVPRLCELVNMSEDFSPDKLMDMFDEALQETERLTGEVSDAVTNQAFVNVAEKFGLVEALARARFVDPLQFLLNDGDDEEGGSDEGEPSPESKPNSFKSGKLGKIAGLVGKFKGKGRKSRSSVADLATNVTLPHVVDLVKRAVAHNFLFKHLQAEALEALVGRMKEVKCEVGVQVMAEGEKGDFFYVVESGVYDVIKGGAKVHTYRVMGDAHPSFGELALMYAKPRSATVVCVEAGTLWGIDRAGFREAQKSYKGVDVIKLLSKVSLLSMLRLDQLQQLRDQMSEMSFAAGEYVITQGEEGDHFYVLVKGAAIVRKRRTEDDDEEDIAMLGQGMCFGEQALLNNAPRGASIVAREELQCMVLNRRTFEQVLGPLQKLINQHAEEREKAALKLQQERQAAGLANASRKNFRLRHAAAAGRGADGSTSALAGHMFVATLTPADNDLAETNAFTGSKTLMERPKLIDYTLRIESKARAVEANQQQEVMAEVALLKQLASSHQVAKGVLLPRLCVSFQDEKALYWVFKTRIATTLQHLVAEHGPLDASMVIFIVACLTTALSVLHELGVVLRGVAMPLLLIDDHGYVVVSELRYARELQGDEESYSMVGMPEYLAPEQVSGAGHSFSVDWWALGTLLYELMCGGSPFAPEGVEGKELQVAQAIIEHPANGLDFWACKIKDQAPLQQFCQALVHPSARRRPAPDELFKHEALKDVDWPRLREGSLESPLMGKATAILQAGLETSEAAQLADPKFNGMVGDPAWCVDF